MAIVEALVIGIIAGVVASLCYALIKRVVRPKIKIASVIIHDEDNDIKIVLDKRNITVWHDKEVVWVLPAQVRAQSFLYEDADHDGRKDLIVLCWRRGRYGKHKPTWVKRDEIKWSQHIFLYEVSTDTIRPKWMASDIGVKARGMSFEDKALLLTDTDGVVSKWIWRSWGFEKM